MNWILSGLCAVAITGLSTTFAAADTTIHVTLSDMGGILDFSKMHDLGMGGHGDPSLPMVMLTADKDHVSAGKVTFAVTNTSKDSQHEMIVLPLKNKDMIPKFIENENRADEDDPHSLGEVSELDPGKSGELTILLKKGYYVLFCNIPGHYDAGMWTRLTVE